MVCIIFLCFMIVFCPSNGKEGTENQEDNFKEFCKDLNLRVRAEPDSERCTLAVYLKPHDSSYIGCFRFYDVYLLTREKEEVAFFRVEYDDKNDIAVHKFQNVISGLYKILIKPYCTLKKCPRMEIEYGPFINMTSNICRSNRIETPSTSFIDETSTTSFIDETSTTSFISETPTTSFISETPTTSFISETPTTSVTSKIYPFRPITESPPNDTKTTVTVEIYHSEYQNSLKQRIIIIVMTTILLLIICTLIYLESRKKKRSLCRNASITSNHKDNNNCVVQNTDLEIQVYIIHYYDRKGKMKEKVEIIKDFLLKLSYFSSVKLIEDELAVILFNVSYWLNDVLNERQKDGTVNRVILITSQEENEPDDDEIENQIYSAFLEKINNKDEQCFFSNDNLYFVQFDNSIIHSIRCGNIVWQYQYSLCGESTLDHMMDLCVNLCSGLKLETHLVQKRIRELLINHPVRHFENSLKYIECI